MPLTRRYKGEVSTWADSAAIRVSCACERIPCPRDVTRNSRVLCGSSDAASQLGLRFFRNRYPCTLFRPSLVTERSLLLSTIEPPFMKYSPVSLRLLHSLGRVGAFSLRRFCNPIQLELDHKIPFIRACRRKNSLHIEDVTYANSNYLFTASEHSFWRILNACKPNIRIIAERGC